MAFWVRLNLLCLFLDTDIKFSSRDILIGLCLGLSMTIMMTDIVKITVGRPRPDMLDRCQPAPGSIDPPLGLSNYTICTTDLNSYMMRDGFKSFPSGHSSCKCKVKLTYVWNAHQSHAFPFSSFS
jgi:membrane-associated phospholipid phosphatase